MAIRSAPIRAPHELNTAQRNAFDLIGAGIATRKFCTFLLYGVTGSGKTEVYLNAIDAALAAGRGALMLVPEIALTPAVAGQFYARFGDRVAILHSAFSDSERAEQWRRIRAGGASVVVGTRSGVFAPVRNLGLIVVDEEHDASYKQEETPRYHGRDVAIVRAQAAGACVVLGSATPESREPIQRAAGKYTLLEIPDRIADRPMPTVQVIDMRQEFLETRKHAIFSRALIEAIRERLENNEQAMILLNRRGFSTFVACRSCGERVECVNCAVTLTYHRRDRRLLCHYCGYAEKIPSVCPKCGSEHIHFMGSGSERVEDELHGEFPEAKIARLDRDTVAGKRQFEDILQNFRERNFDILVGTQMIAKGHDIPNVTLVGVVSADVGIGMPDFRAAERTFQILTQVAGRAGRGDLPGRGLHADHQPGSLCDQVRRAAGLRGIFRERAAIPAVHEIPAVRGDGEHSDPRGEAGGRAADVDGTGPSHHARAGEYAHHGPAEAPVPRLKAEFRYQMLIKSGSRKDLNALLRKAQEFRAGAEVERDRARDRCGSADAAVGEYRGAHTHVCRAPTRRALSWRSIPAGRSKSTPAGRTRP